MTRHPSFRAIGLSALSGSLLLGACGGGGGGGGGAPPPVDPLQSSLTVNPPFGAASDGLTQVDVVAVVADAAGNPLAGRTVVLEVTGLANTVQQPGQTNAAGTAQGKLSTAVGEKKSIVAVVDPGPNEIRLGPVTSEFLRILPSWRFVRATGNDAADGRSPLTAWRTLAFALTQVTPGQELFVGAGTYAETLTIATAATAEAPLRIRGDRAGEFTGDPGEILIDAGGATAGVTLQGASFVFLRGLTIRGADGGPAAGAGLRATAAQDCAVLDCRLFENEAGIELVNCQRMTLEENRVSANLGDGLRFSGTTGVRALQNLVYENGGDGIELVTPSTALELASNTLFRNDGVQLRESVAGGTGTIVDNVLSEGTGMGFSLAGGTNLVPAKNLAWLQAGNNPSPALVADPLFLDPFGPDGILGGIGAEDDDFRLDLASPALDAGLGDAHERTLFLRGALSAATSRDDGVADGSDPDADLANLGFHYPIALDLFSSLAPQGGRAAFAMAGDVRVRTRAWSRTNGGWGLGLRTQAMNSELRWLVQRVAPDEQPAEILAGLATTAAGTQLFVRTWDGRRWSDDVPAITSTAIPLANADERGFDVEFETQSGDAVLAFADGATNVRFQTWTDGAWSAPAPVFAPALATGTILWVELVPKPGTDTVALVALDDQQKLIASIWDGTQWTLPLLLATQVNALHDWKAFDAAWEGVTGDLLVAWGYSAFIEETRYATLIGNTWVTGQHNSTDALGLTVKLAADPTTNRVAAIFGEGDSDDDVGVAVWDGAHWTNTAEFSLTGQPQSRAMDVGWFGDTGRAFAIYRDQDLTGAFQWAVFNPAGWKRQGEVTFAGVGKIVQAETRVLPGDDRVLMLLLDEAGKLFAFEYDGTAWLLRNNSKPLATGLDVANKGRAFDLDLRRN